MKNISAFLFFAMLACTPKETDEAVFSNKSTVSETVQLDTPRVENGWVMVDSSEAARPRMVPAYTLRPAPEKVAWEALLPGLDYAEIDLPMRCNIGDSKVRILRGNLSKVSLQLLTAGELQLPAYLTAQQYVDQYSLFAAINSSMFGTNAKSVGYMKHGNYVNNAVFGKDKAVIAFHPVSAEWPPFKIIDTTCEDWRVWNTRYRTYIQNIRIVDCQRVNRWSKQEKFWSCAFLGEDTQGRVLFIHSRTPYRVHDLANMLLALPIGLQRCCYLEGGPESSLVIHAGGKAVAQFGSFETGFVEDDDNASFWPIPNVLALVKKE